MSTLRAGIVGCGAVTELHHVAAIRQCPDLSLTAVVDADAARARQFAERHGASTSLADYRELAGKIDVALVATSNVSHAEIACFLLDHGIHVLCEKPLAPSVADAKKMAAAADRSGARLMAAHSRRFNPNVELCCDLVSRGFVGKLETVSAALSGSYGAWPSRTDFRRQRVGGGVLLDLGVHLIDFALSLGTGPARVVSCVASDALGWGVENDVDLTLELAGGGRAMLSCSYALGLRRSIRIDGDGGWIETPLDGAPYVMFFGERSRVCERLGAQRLLVPEADPYQRQIDHFARAVIEQRPFAVPLDQVIAGLEVIENCAEFGRAA